MTSNRVALPVSLAVVFSLSASAQPKPQPKAEGSVGGVFVGRTGKPITKAKLLLGQVLGDQVLLYARIKLLSEPPAVTDENGRFQFQGLAPGTYTIVYQLAGASGLPPAEINIKALSAETKSILPMLRGVEIGNTGEPFAERLWGREFTLLKGHTFHSEGTNMRIWNATLRRGQQGPYLEVRRGVIWQERLDSKSPIKLTAWGY